MKPSVAPPSHLIFYCKVYNMHCLRKIYICEIYSEISKITFIKRGVVGSQEFKFGCFWREREGERHCPADPHLHILSKLFSLTLSLACILKRSTHPLALGAAKTISLELLTFCWCYHIKVINVWLRYRYAFEVTCNVYLNSEDRYKMPDLLSCSGMLCLNSV